jgi:CoA:oxalate CoA-transferase
MGMLDGIRVLDLSRVLAGPYCTALLADLGADVVKVEPPSGDDARHLGPFRQGESVYFAQLNRGKRSVVLDLKNPADHETLLRLAAQADVVVENFRPGVAARLAVGPADLIGRNPRLIYASISGFGQTGPMAALPAYDLIVQAMSGLMAGTGPEGGQPTRVGESVGDLCAGLFASWAICAALFDRERSGRGRHLDVSMLDALVSLQVTGMSLLTATGRLPGRIGNRHPVSAPFDTFRTADGAIAVAVASDVVFARFAAMVGQPDLPSDPRFADDTARSSHITQLREMTEAWSIPLTTAEALALSQTAGVPAAPIWDLEQAIASEQIQHRALVGEFDHPVLGRTPFLRQPVHFDAGTAGETVGADGRATATPSSPQLGEHAAQVILDWCAARAPVAGER